MKTIKEMQTEEQVKIEDKKPTIQQDQWVEMYHALASYVEEMSALDPIFDDNGMRTKESEEKWIDIVDNVENIMGEYLKKRNHLGDIDE